MKTAHKVWSKQEILRLIERYQQYEILWNNKIPQYKNRALKQESLRELSLEFKTPVSEIQRKVHNLRCQLNSEVKKLNKRKLRSGLDDGTLKSSWEYFEPLLFILSASSKDYDDIEGFDISDHLETMIEAEDNISIQPDEENEDYYDSKRIQNKQEDMSDHVETMMEPDIIRIKQEEDNEDYQDSTRVLGETKRQMSSDQGDTQSDLSQDNAKESVPSCSRFKDSHLDSIYQGLRGVRNMKNHEIRVGIPLKKKKFLETVNGSRDDCQIFGDFVAAELRNLKSLDNRRKLKLIIQKAIVDITESEVGT